jgi:hypothetical protein
MADGMLSDERLAAVLASVGAHLVTDAGAAGGAGARDDLVAARWRRTLLAAAVALAVIAGAVVAIAPARRAVGGWLRIGRVEVEIAPAVDTAALPALTDGATRIAPGDADALLGTAMPPVGVSTLGPPTDWWTLPEGGVVVGWGDGETSLWVLPTAGDDEYLKKVASTGEVVAEVPTLGDGGIVVRGPHLFQSPQRRVAADTVVLWTAGDLLFRLEGNAEPEQLLAVAEQLTGTAPPFDRS